MAFVILQQTDGLMMSQRDCVILVNEADETLGAMEKLTAHRQGLLHRAFSVFIVNDKNEMLLQQRADDKYHSGGLWSNACCSHPFPGENTLQAAHRRLREELGFDCELHPLSHLRYKAEVGNGLVENEYDYIFWGEFKGAIQPNKKEVKDYKFISFQELENRIKSEPQVFTKWFHLALPVFVAALKTLNGKSYPL